MKKILSVLLPVLALVGFSSIFIVDETEQVVILQLGKPVKTVTNPGLNLRKFHFVAAAFKISSKFKFNSEKIL